MGVNDADMAGLSEEERAALEDDGDEQAILREIADATDGGAGGATDQVANDDDDDEDDDEDKSNETPATDGVNDEPQNDGADAPTSEQGKRDESTPEAPADDQVAVGDFQPEFIAAGPEGLAEKMAELDTRSNDLLNKFQDGDIAMPEFIREKDAIDSERMALRLAAEQAKWASAQNESMRDQRWKWEQERFFNQSSASIYKDAIVLAALNASVKQLAADLANAKRPANWFLEEADRQVRRRMSPGVQAAPAKDSDKPSKPTVRTPDLSGIPKTLAQLPAADIAETGEGEFAYLDKLDGIALEAALRKLTPEQEARYLGASS